MSTVSKVLWGEGLFLRPQHFQQQDQYHEHRLHESVKALHPYAWGVAHLQLDREALESNTLRVLRWRWQLDAPLQYWGSGPQDPGFNACGGDS